jgi:predicted Zn-dependent protease
MHRIFPLMSLVLFMAVTGCQPTAPAAKFIDQADRLHRGALASTVVADSDLNEYVQEVGDRVVAAARVVAPNKVNDAFISRVRCEVVISNTINAFSTGGTHVYITTGLLRQCETEEQLTAAIAHAYAHLLNLDLEATKMKPDPAVPLQLVVWNFVTNRYTREQERSADALAAAIFAQAGYDPERFGGLFERMEGFNGGRTAPDRESLPGRAADAMAAASTAKRSDRALPVADPETYASLREKAAKFEEPATETVPLVFLRAFPNCVLAADTPEQLAAQARLKPIPPPTAKLEPN